MQKSEILATLTQLLQDVLDDDDVVLTTTTTAKDVSGWDSLANIRFVLAIERKFKTQFAASEIARLSNVGELVEMVLARQ